MSKKKSVVVQSKAVNVSGLGPAQAGTDLVAAIKNLATSSSVASSMTAKDRKQLVHEARFNRSFVEAVADRYEAHPEIAEPEFDVQAMRASLATVASYQPAITALKTMLRALQDQVLEEKMSVATQSNALVTYLRAVASTQRGLAIRGDVAELNKLREPKRKSPAKPKAAAPTSSPADSTTSK